MRARIVKKVESNYELVRSTELDRRRNPNIDDKVVVYVPKQGEKVAKVKTEQEKKFNSTWEAIKEAAKKL